MMDLIVNDYNLLEKEKKIINSTVYDSRDKLESIILEYETYLKDNGFKSDARTQIVNNIIEYFIKVIYCINRFSEFKSKIRVITKSKSLSRKEIERCDFVIKLSKNDVKILKNVYRE